MKNRLAVTDDQVLREPDAVARLAQQACERLAAHLPRLRSQVVAVDLKQVECVQKRLTRAEPSDRSAQEVEVRHAVRATDHALPSSVTDLTRSFASASAIRGTRSVKSLPRRLYTRTR